MERSGPIYDATESFKAFIETFDSRHSPNDPSGRYLQTYLTGWLRSGDGVVETGGNSQTYLRVALNIADAAMRKQIDFDYLGGQGAGSHEDGYARTVEALHEPGNYGNFESHYADPAQYERIARHVELAQHEGRSIDDY